MKKVFLVMATYAYEGSDIVRAYASMRAAGAFAQRCRDHAAKRPPYPTVIEDTPENDALHAEAWERMKRWEARHPARFHTGADVFNVRAITVRAENRRGT